MERCGTDCPDPSKEKQQQQAARDVAGLDGPKVVPITLAIKRLFDTVAAVVEELRNDGAGRVGDLRLALWLGSLVLAGFNRLACSWPSVPPISVNTGDEPLR